MIRLSCTARGYALLSIGLIAGCSDDLAGPAAETPAFDRSVRVAALVITVFPGTPLLSDGTINALDRNSPSSLQVRALDKKGRPLSRIKISAESVDWAAHWTGLASPPPDPAAQTVTTDAAGMATFTLTYPSAMRRVVTWRATAGKVTVETFLSVDDGGIDPICSSYFGQYTQEEFPECFD